MEDFYPIHTYIKQAMEKYIQVLFPTGYMVMEQFTNTTHIVIKVKATPYLIALDFGLLVNS
jgi:hypothetical protein